MTSIAWSLLDSLLLTPPRHDDPHAAGPALPSGPSLTARRWTLPTGSAAVPAARARVAAAACDLDRPTVEVALLLTVDLVTTAVVGGHATRARLDLDLTDDALQVRLDADYPAPLPSQRVDEPPLHLALISACAADWGAASARSSSVTRSLWFRLDLPGPFAGPDR
jgi:hypothetical protein